MTTRDTIVEQWFAAAIEMHGGATAAGATKSNDPFRNPVGHVLHVNLSALAAELLDAMDPAAIAAAFENVVAVRAIQDVSVAQALEFVYALRRIVRDAMPAADRDEIDRRIDRLALAAFEQFLGCRERLLGLRLNEQLRALGPQPFRLRGSAASQTGGDRTLGKIAIVPATTDAAAAGCSGCAR